MRIVDTHAHLHFAQFAKDVDRIIKQFNNNGIEFVVNVGISVEDSERALSLSDQYDRVYCSIGVHPHEAAKVDRSYIDRFREMALNKNVVAVGETGLDYYRNISPKDDQLRVFAEQIMLSHELNLPLIIHIRDAYKDAYDLLKDLGLPPAGGVIHAFSADSSWAMKFVELGAFLGIGGPITYPKNNKLRSAVLCVGLDNIVTETDCPYLPPQAFRGKRNEPRYISLVIEEIARVLKEDIDVVSQTLLSNAKELFMIE